jgi:hypothetical protein
MTVDYAHTYTDPPQRVSTELSGGGGARRPSKPST